ncbi:hypothetical protein HDU98_010804 [Podochytrium sp. JEL0797]|nr:hypothetical protein HDU98_010804 [Podochytrium sp. JEL0797]
MTVEVEDRENVAPSTPRSGASPYYTESKFDPRGATIAELKTILSKHGVALPSGSRVLKEEYVVLFIALRDSSPPFVFHTPCGESVDSPVVVGVPQLVTRFEKAAQKSFGTFSLNETFGFARRTALEAPKDKETKPKPNNALANRPDFAVPVVPRSGVSLTGLSPPHALIDNKKKKMSPSRIPVGAKTSPQGLRSSGPRRVPTSSAKKHAAAKAAELTPPFNPYKIAQVDKMGVSSPLSNALDLSESSPTKPALPSTPSPPVAQDASVDAEFKRKYNLQDSDSASDMSSDEEDAVRLQSPNKRQKSVSILTENDYGPLTPSFYDKLNLPVQQSPRAFATSLESSSPSTGKYNLRSRKVPSTSSFSSSSPSKPDSAPTTEPTEPTSTPAVTSNDDPEIEVDIILKPAALRRVLRTFGSIFLAAFLLPIAFALACWTYEIVLPGLEYCPAAMSPQDTRWVPASTTTRGIAIDFWGKVLPACVSCPGGSVCDGAEVVSCVNAGEVVAGEEGLGPFGEWVGLGAGCFIEDRVSALVVEDVNEQRVNTRVKGRTVPLGVRVEGWKGWWVAQGEAGVCFAEGVWEQMVQGDVAKSAMDVAVVMRAGVAREVKKGWKGVSGLRAVKWEWVDDKLEFLRRVKVLFVHAVGKGVVVARDAVEKGVVVSKEGVQKAVEVCGELVEMGVQRVKVLVGSV